MLVNVHCIILMSTMMVVFGLCLHDPVHRQILVMFYGQATYELIVRLSILLPALLFWLSLNFKVKVDFGSCKVKVGLLTLDHVMKYGYNKLQNIQVYAFPSYQQHCLNIFS